MSQSASIITTGYTPRPIQFDLHRKLKRFNVLVCHRRFGKTIFAINHTIANALRNKKPMPRYLYVAPDRGQAKRICWDIFKMYTQAIPGVTTNEAELRIDIPLDSSGINTIRIQLMGAENPDSLRGPYYDGVIFDEYADMLPSVWTKIVRPAVMDRGGWAIFIGTPKGKNSFCELFEYACKSGDPEWFGALYRASETGIIPESELESAKRTMDEDEYNQEMECSFVASSKGAYYGREMALAMGEKRIRVVPWEPSVPVHTAWDLGLSDYMSVWYYQEVFNEIRLIKYRQTEGEGFEQWGKALQLEDYIYGTHFMPHDASVREMSDAKDRRSKAEALGIKPIEVAPKLFVIDGIHQARGILHRCWFDQLNAEDGITCLREYKKKWDEKRKIFLEEPLHDQYSHGADAFRTLALTIGKRREVRKDLPRRVNNDYNRLGGFKR